MTHPTITCPTTPHPTMIQPTMAMTHAIPPSPTQPQEHLWVQIGAFSWGGPQRRLSVDKYGNLSYDFRLLGS